MARTAERLEAIPYRLLTAATVCTPRLYHGLDWASIRMRNSMAVAIDVVEVNVARVVMAAASTSITEYAEQDGTILPGTNTRSNTLTFSRSVSFRICHP